MRNTTDTYDYHCPDCRPKRTKNFGADELGRDLAVNKHLREYPDHAVTSRRIVIQHVYTGRQAALFEASSRTSLPDDPPF